MQEANTAVDVDDRIRDALATQAASTRAEFVRALDSQRAELTDLSHIAAEVLHTRDQQVRPFPCCSPRSVPFSCTGMAPRSVLAGESPDMLQCICVACGRRNPPVERAC